MEEFVDALGIKKASFLMHDYGGPVGFRMISRRPELLDAMMIMNANAYQEGLTASSQPLFDYWKNPSGQNEAILAQLLTVEGTKFQYYDGVSDQAVINPAAVYTDQFFLDRKGNKEIQLTLLYDYQNNVSLYPEWQELFSKLQPATLVVWGENDKFFSKAGALKYGVDLTHIEYAFYPTGHFPLAEFHQQIAEKVDVFLRHNLRWYNGQ